MNNVACDKVRLDMESPLQLQTQAGCVYLQHAVIGQLRLLAFIGRHQLLSQAAPAHDHL